MNAKLKTAGVKVPRSHERAASTLTLDQRMAFSLRETASILGISYSSAFRLCQRGALRSTPGLRRKVIGKEELIRYLRT